MEDAQNAEPRRERLELPATSQLERRLLVGDAAPPQRPRHKPAIKPVAASALLGRLQAFLPALQAANAALEQQLEHQPASEVSMERGSNDEQAGPVVEMDLACGLFDLKDEAAVAAAERAMLARGVAVESFDGGGSSNTDSSDSSGSGSGSGSEDGGLSVVEAGEGGRQVPGAAAGSGGDGGDVMQTDGPAAADGSGTGVAVGGGQARQPPGGSAGTGRRRQGKRRGSKRHAGIEELS